MQYTLLILVLSSWLRNKCQSKKMDESQLRTGHGCQWRKDTKIKVTVKYHTNPLTPRLFQVALTAIIWKLLDILIVRTVRQSNADWKLVATPSTYSSTSELSAVIDSTLDPVTEHVVVTLGDTMMTSISSTYNHAFPINNASQATMSE